MRAIPAVLLWLTCSALTLGAGCDRKLEPYDPQERPAAPDLSRIFPEGARRAAPAEPVMPPAPGAGGGRGAPPVAASSAEPIHGTVRIGEGLADRVRETSVLFVIARAGAAGPPLAVQRVPDPHFPFEFSIGPDDRMIKSMPFVGPLRITARLDSDGNATSRNTGDLQGSAPGSYEPGAEGVTIVLDELL